VDPKRWQRICAIFEAARELRGEARAALLASAPDVAEDVQELLGHHETGGGVLRTEASEPEVGTRIGPYEIERVLGRGGMATVYLAAGPEGVVALKRLRPELCQEASILERFRREAELGARIRHENVIRTFGREGPDCLVLEYLEGRTLEQLLEDSGPLPETLCRHIGREVARGLVAIHAAGAVHRDLKPSNVLLTEDDGVRVMDLGIALPLDDLLRLSRTGQFVGTVRYSAPEQVTSSKAEVDARTDLYALGLLLYELAAGRHPLPRGGLVTTMRAQLEVLPEPLRSVNTLVTPFFETLVHALLPKAPEDRLASAERVLVILDEGEDGAWWQEHVSRPSS